MHSLNLVTSHASQSEADKTFESAFSRSFLCFFLYLSHNTAIMKFFSLAIAAVINLSLAGLASGEDRRMIIGYKKNNGKAAIMASAKAVHHDLSKQNALAVTLPDAAIEALRNNPNIAYIEEDAKRYHIRSVRGAEAPNNQEEKSLHRHLSETVPFGIEMVQADLVKFIAPKPSGAYQTKKICIIDTGYSMGHEDLPIAGVTGTDDSKSGVWSQDGNGHGTHVAGMP
jgi:subtilisin family serine protease